MIRGLEKYIWVKSRDFDLIFLCIKLKGKKLFHNSKKLEEKQKVWLSPVLYQAPVSLR